MTPHLTASLAFGWYLTSQPVGGAKRRRSQVFCIQQKITIEKQVLTQSFWEVVEQSLDSLSLLVLWWCSIGSASKPGLFLLVTLMATVVLLMLIAVGWRLEVADCRWGGRVQGRGAGVTGRSIVGVRMTVLLAIKKLSGMFTIIKTYHLTMNGSSHQKDWGLWEV